MVDSRDKGSRAELAVRNYLRQATGLGWERTPSSGALNEKHGLKADLYVPNEKNIYAVEVKHYAEDHLTSSILTTKNPQLIEWWKQTERQAKQVNRKPLLIFKFDRSKLFVAFADLPSSEYKHFMVNISSDIIFFVSLLEDFLKYENPKFIA